ncbi:MAG: hypothetical protein WCO68_10505 [Verrucomicrobiota bacterium]
MGLTHFVSKEPHRSEIAMAKNYLPESELEILNRTVNASRFEQLTLKSHRFYRYYLIASCAAL